MVFTIWPWCHVRATALGYCQWTLLPANSCLPVLSTSRHCFQHNFWIYFIYVILNWRRLCISSTNSFADWQCRLPLTVMNDPPLFPFPLCHPFVSPFLDPYQTFTSTSMLSPSSPTSSDFLYDSFYESFLFLAYDSFRLIAWVTPIFRYDSLWLILRVILIFRPSDPPMTHSMSHLYT